MSAAPDMGEAAPKQAKAKPRPSCGGVMGTEACPWFVLAAPTAPNPTGVARQGTCRFEPGGVRTQDDAFCSHHPAYGRR